MPPVQPAVGAPFEAVDHVVAYTIVIPPVQDDLGFSIRNVIQIGIGNEQKVGSAGSPDSAETYRQPRQSLQVIVKDGFLVRPSVSVDVFEDHDAVT